MPQKIADYTFISISGQIGYYGYRVNELTRPGISGHTFRRIGKRGEQSQLQTRSTHSDRSTAAEMAKQYERLGGTFVSIQLNGQTYSRVLIHSVTSRVRELGTSTDGKSFMVESSWQVQRAGE